MTLTAEQTNAFEGTELEGVLPSIQYVIHHLESFDEQFELAVKHLRNAARATYKVGTAS